MSHQNAKERRPTGAQAFISIRHAAFRLGERLVFQNLDWRFGRDEHWAIIGGNGSGKSLLADALRGQLPLVSGQLRYHFRPPRGLAPEEAIGHLSFDDRKLDVRNAVVQSRWNSLEEDGALLVRDFLSYERVMDINPFEVRREENAGSRLARDGASDQDGAGSSPVPIRTSTMGVETSGPPPAPWPSRRAFARRLARAVRWLRLEPFWDRTLLSLSNGERQRVQLGQALCHPLRLLILDEPFTGLDASARGEFRQLLDGLMAASVRVLLVTTRLDELPRRLTHILRVEDCRLVAAGTRQEMLARCGEPFKAGSSPPSSAARSPAPPAAAPSSPRETAAPELVRLREVTVRYGSSTILRDLDWTVRAGESWALLGPNGSGKTTLLSLILGDNPQMYNNDVVVFGRRRGTGESIWEIKRAIGWVSPELQLHFDDALTCLDAVLSGFFDTVGVFERPTSRQRARARQWLARFGLLAHQSAALYSISAGWQRMVLLARALVKRPRLLILDEPCQGLDAPHRDLFLAALDELLRDGSVTAIYVTHRREEIPPSIHRVLRLQEGSGVESTRRGR